GITQRKVSGTRVFCRASLVHHEIPGSLNRGVGRNSGRLDASLCQIRGGGGNRDTDTLLNWIPAARRTELLIEQVLKLRFLRLEPDRVLIRQVVGNDREGGRTCIQA